MKSTNRWYPPASLDTPSRVSGGVFWFVVICLGAMLISQGKDERAAQEKTRVLEKALDYIEQERANLEQGIMACADNKTLWLEFPATKDHVEVACQRKSATLWNVSGQKSKKKEFKK